MSSIISPKYLSVVVIAVTVVWIGSGLIFGTSRTQEHASSSASGADVGRLLKVESLTAKPFTQQITINGATKANRMVELKPEVEGRVVELPVKKGTQVAAGQLIVRLDDRDRKEKLAEAKAKVAAREIEYKASQTLEQKGYRPRIGLADSKANLEIARVELAQAQLNYQNTRITAPFAGRIEELNVELGDFLLSGHFGSMNGRVMARLVEDQPILVAGQISERDLPLVNKNAPVDVVLSGGRTLVGTISFMGQYANGDSRSFPVEVMLDNADRSIPVGLTATIKLAATQASAYQISSSMMALDDTGKIGVKLVDESGVVRFAPVEVIANTDQGVWVTGLPEQVKLVTQGQAFVNEGQKLDTQGEKASGS